MAPKSKKKRTGRQRLRNFKRNLRSDTPEGRSAKIYLGVAIIVIGLFTAVMVNAPWAGGWEITSSLRSVYIEDELFTTTNLHEFDTDIDGSWNEWVAQNDPPNPYNDYYDIELGKVRNPMDFGYPEIEVSTSYPYYIERLDDGTWVKTDSPEPIDEYNVTLSETPYIIQAYNHWTVGLDVIIETEAESFLKPNGVFADYGYFYEAKMAEVDVWVQFAVTPWVPTGTSGNWTINDGWSGIMSASVFNYDYGKVDEDADENYGHVIQGLEQKGQALNMDHSQINFDNPSGIEGVPSSISAEVSVDLGAGAMYTTDILGHWDMVTVRNVFVKYNIRFDVVTTLIWELELGHQGDMDNPDEDNTGYQPEITPWKQFLEGINEFIQGPIFIIVMLVIIIIGGMVLYKLFSRGDNQ